MKRRSPLGRSTKALLRDAEYGFQRTKVLSARPKCQRCGSEPATEVHHLKPRGRGGSLTDPRNMIAIGRKCHDWIHQNPEAAAAEGLLLHSWEDDPA